MDSEGGTGSLLLVNQAREGLATGAVVQTHVESESASIADMLCDLT